MSKICCTLLSSTINKYCTTSYDNYKETFFRPWHYIFDSDIIFILFNIELFFYFFHLDIIFIFFQPWYKKCFDLNIIFIFSTLAYFFLFFDLGIIFISFLYNSSKTKLFLNQKYRQDNAKYSSPPWQQLSYILFPDHHFVHHFVEKLSL